jgi:hypothetical protein
MRERKDEYASSLVQTDLQNKRRQADEKKLDALGFSICGLANSPARIRWGQAVAI